MITRTGVLSGMSTDDLAATAAFYRDTLGFEVEETTNGLSVRSEGQRFFIYPKPDHRPATYTAVYIEVPDIDAAVDELIAAGVELERYEGLHQDEKGISRGLAAGMGPDIAWFTDPAGNILAVLNG
jgi:catechol 2,3-dioxygenase-like lactoylglutathione lyase family enzyme